MVRVLRLIKKRQEQRPKQRKYYKGKENSPNRKNFNRFNFIKTYYKEENPNDKSRIIHINNPYGIEDNLDEFCKISQKLTKGSPEKVSIKLDNCKRLWPSGIMFLASYHHWFTLKFKAKQEIVMEWGRNSAVYSYSSFSGLITYTTSNNPILKVANTSFDKNEIIKLRKRV